MKKINLFLMVIVSNFYLAQVGINTANPQGSFHVDGAKDNPQIGLPNESQQANDFNVTADGKVGIGKINPTSNLHIQNRGSATGIGSGEATNTGLLVENPITNSSILSILRTSGTTGVKQAVMGINPNFNSNNGIFLISRTVGGSEFAIDLTNGNVGIANNAPTETLDVAGKVRVRTTDIAGGSTIIYPIYSDPSGVLVKISTSNTFGQLVSNDSGQITSGSTATLINGLPNGSIYRAVVKVQDGCGNIGLAEYYIYTQTLNNFQSINGLGGILTGGTTQKSPTFNQISRDVISTTWTGKANCSAGGSGIAFNHTLTVIPGSVQITNNGDTNLNYLVTLTRLN
ncbi:hypothetical protein [Chryseobacterium sp. MMS23-Vi53]|uniref:hypothetical protein n=1 Tax=Chryseobacterium sp. MMS23-Vi53 TaxID=3386644 RepID=UPI0039EC8AF6